MPDQFKVRSISCDQPGAMGTSSQGYQYIKVQIAELFSCKSGVFVRYNHLTRPLLPA
jgi:hypothetical protein